MAKPTQLKRVRDNALLAVCYFVAGYIGISLAVPPGYATIIWPASGIALCALLARGGGLWPGIWLGSFAINVMTSFDSSANFSDNWRVLAIACCIGTGASVQALAGLRMARGFASGIELTNFRLIARAMMLVVVLPCIIAPSIGVATLVLFGTLDGASLSENWLTWYLGDLLGVILVIPILLLSRHSPVTVRWREQSLQGTSSLVAISLAATVLLTFYAWRFISEREYQQAEASFAAMATDTDEALRHRLEIYQRALEAGSAFASSTSGVTPARWREYVEHIEISQAYPGMRGFGMFEAVSHEDLPAFEEAFAREFGDRFEVHPRVVREEHFIINRIEPLDKNVAALGLDLAFEEGRREAIRLSTQREEPVLTRPIVLVQDENQGAGFLLVFPVSNRDGSPTRRWVYSPLVAEELLSALTPRQGDEFDLDVYFGDQPDPQNAIFSSRSSSHAPHFELQRTIELAGQPITLRWTSLPSFEHRYASSAPILVLVGGLLISALLGLLLSTFLRREADVVRKVHEATRELEERNRMLEMAEATAHIGHWHLNLADERVTWSDEVFRLYGLPIGVAPELGEAINFFHPEDRNIVEQSIATAISDKKPYRFKARLISVDGEIRHVEVRGAVDLGPGDEVVAILGVIIDRTDETLLRQQLTEAFEEARAADKAKSSFLANMSHEIRTPMNGVIGFTELALSEEKDPAQKRRLQMIADSGGAMLRLLNDLLDFAKIEAKQMAVVIEPADLRHTLRSCQRLMEPVAEEKNVPLLLDIDHSLPAMVLIDKMRVRQIVLNLVGNALKFTEEGQVKISASVSRRRSDPSSRVHITVADTGIGIPPDRLNSIFEKFTQADDTTARRFGGTGLGLPISRELAELMGGELRAKSELGSGSSFTLTLPFEESSAVVASHDFDEPPVDCGHLSKMRILVAEDNPVNQELMIAMVERTGHHSDLASDGREAVEAVLQAHREGRPYGMVLMDMQMPQMDGLEATRAIRDAGFDARNLPILAVTANAYSDDIQRCEAAGMQAHLAKPLRFQDLCDAIGRWSSGSNDDGSVVEAAIEESVDPHLREMFEEQKAEAIEAIEAVLDQTSIKQEEKTDVAELLHKIAGTAAYFGQQDLGEICRSHQRLILDSKDDRTTQGLLEEARNALERSRSHECD